jgi:hypothetical protein
VREEFEKWAVESGLFVDKWDTEIDEYVSHGTSWALRGWQAATALQAERVREMEEALQDMLAGWKYIREAHGDLYGVGWDRAQEKAEQALSATAREERNEQSRP